MIRWPGQTGGFPRHAAIIFGAWAACLGAIFFASFLALIASVENDLYARVLRGESEAFRASDEHGGEVWQPYLPGVDGGPSMDALRDRLPDGFDPSNPDPQILTGRNGREIRAIALDPERGEHSRVIMMDTSVLLDRPERSVRYLGYLGLAALLVILSTASVSYIAGRQIAQPVRRLSRLISAPRQTLQNGELVRQSGPSELREMAAALDGSLSETRAALQRERVFNLGLSHELRSALQTAEQALELLQMDAPGMDHPAIHKRLGRALGQMRGAAEAVLWLSREESVEPRDLSGDVRAVVASFEADARARHCSLEPDIQPSVRAALPREVVQVLAGNLLRNAIQHSGSKRVEVILTDGALSVRDFGTGLTRQQLDAARAGYPLPDASGAGLGLSLCYRLARRFEAGLTLTCPEDGGTLARIEWHASD